MPNERPPTKKTVRASKSASALPEYRIRDADDGICETMMPDVNTEHVILRLKTLPVSCDSSSVEGYSAGNSCFSVIEESLEAEPASNPQAVEKQKTCRILLPELTMSEDRWPATTCTACFWCCHRFNDTPIGLPISWRHGKYSTCGCFCSFECAAKFNFSSSELGQKPWSSYQMLCRLAAELGHGAPIELAPSRFCLKMFGGWMEIDEFRSSSRPLLSPAPLPYPMVSVMQYMEDMQTVNEEASQGNKPTFVPLDNDRVNRAKQNMLRVKSKKNAIHSRMALANY
jgi:hypothetical protein